MGPYTVKTVLPYQTYELERNGKFSVQHDGRIRCHMGSVPNSQSNTTHTEQPTTGEEPETLQDQIERAVQDQQVLRPRRENNFVKSRTANISQTHRLIEE